MSLSIWHVILVLVVVLIIFGAGKLPRVMGDVAKGIKNFKAGLGSDTDTDNPPAKPAEPPPVTQQRPVETETKSDKDSASR
jgi:sec-independent protein translocase protein TatA